MRPSSGFNNNNNRPAAAQLTSEIESGDRYRHNIDALQTFLKKNSDEKDDHPSQMQARVLFDSIMQNKNRPGIIPVGTKNYYISSAEGIPYFTGADLPALLKHLIELYLKFLLSQCEQDEKMQEKVKASPLYQGYSSMLKGQANPSFTEAMHEQAQSKKWVLISKDEMPDPMKQGFEDVRCFVSYYPVQEDSKIKDLVQISQHNEVKYFRDHGHLIQQLNDAKIQMEIEGKTYYIRGVKQDDLVIFMKCENADQDPKSGTVVSEANINAYKQENHCKSFSSEVLHQLGEHLQDKRVKFQGPDNTVTPPKEQPNSSRKLK